MKDQALYWRDKLLASKFYAILDTGYVSKNNLITQAEKLCEAQVDIIQFRAKNFSLDEIIEYSKQIHTITSSASIPLVINDYPEAVVQSNAEGLHIGQDDISVNKAINFFIKKKYLCFIGQSNHSQKQISQSLKNIDNEYQNFIKQNKDFNNQKNRPYIPYLSYLAYGPLYKTNTKPTYIPVNPTTINAIHKEKNQFLNDKKNTFIPKIPLFFIGGINLKTIKEVRQMGASRVVIVSDLLKTKNFKKYVKQIKNELQQY